MSRPSPLSERRFSVLVLACAILGFLSLIGVAVVAVRSLERTAEHARWVEHSYRVEQRIADLRLLIERLEVQRRGFLLTGNPRFSRDFVKTARTEPATIAILAHEIRDNPRQVTRVRKIEGQADRHLRLLAMSIVRRARGEQVALEADGSVDLTRAIRRYTDAMKIEERDLLRERTATQRRSAIRSQELIAFSGLLLVAVAIFSILVIRRYTRDLVRSREAMRLLNETLEERVAERTRDLTRANDEIQRFAYIVSHDLRSPLVNVMGFTGELEAAARPLSALVAAAEEAAPAIVTEEARIAAREDLPEAIGFIRTSTQKMDRLINAILRLSREGRRVLAAEPLDVAGIADGVVASIRHRVDEAGAEIVVERLMPPLSADRLAFEQILSNLIENAVKYLQPGRPGLISVSAREEGGRIVVAVADNGRGIDPRDHDRVFDLFRRSGAQDQPGEGIGLAHVRALAYRMGGLVSCRSTLGQGSTFILSLPATPTGEFP